MAKTDRELVWSIALPQISEVTKIISTTEYVYASVTYPDGTGGLIKIDCESGKKIASWTTDREITFRPKLTEHGILISTLKGEVELIDYELTERYWRIETESVTTGAVIIEDNQAILTTFRGRIISIELGTGTINWSRQITGLVRASPRVLKDEVCIASTDGEIQLFSTDGRKKESHTLTDGVFLTPTVALEDIIVASWTGAITRLTKQLTVGSNLNLGQQILDTAREGETLFIVTQSSVIIAVDIPTLQIRERVQCNFSGSVSMMASGRYVFVVFSQNFVCWDTVANELFSSTLPDNHLTRWRFGDQVISLGN